MLIVFMSKGVYRGGGKEGSAPPRAVKGGAYPPPRTQTFKISNWRVKNIKKISLLFRMIIKKYILLQCCNLILTFKFTEYILIWI